MNIPTVLLLVLLACTGAALAKEKVVICYHTNWSAYRPGEGSFQIDDIQTRLCSHLIYSYVGINSDGTIRVLDPWQDLPNDMGKDGFRRFNKLREKNPGLKTLLSIGGWNEGSTKFSEVVRDPDTRGSFVVNAVAFLKRYGFNGLDVAWSYPAQRGGIPSDKRNYVKLLKELRQAFDKNNLILTIAAGATRSIASASYLIAEVSEHVHYINLQAYDLNHGSYQKTALNAPIYPSSKDLGKPPMITINDSLNYWLENGAPVNKLVLGIPLHGRSYTLLDPEKHGLGASSIGPGTPGPYTREPGLLGYNEICTTLKRSGWTVVRDAESQVPYAFRDEDWVSYDDVASVRAKAEYIKKKGLAGAMVWSLDTDDFAGVCGDEYPLLTALNDVLSASDPVPTTTPKPTTPKPTTPKPTTPKPPATTKAPA